MDEYIQWTGAPHTWEVYYDDGEPYFYNTHTGETTWETPSEMLLVTSKDFDYKGHGSQFFAAATTASAQAGDMEQDKSPPPGLSMDSDRSPPRAEEQPDADAAGATEPPPGFRYQGMKVEMDDDGMHPSRAFRRLSPGPPGAHDEPPGTLVSRLAVPLLPVGARIALDVWRSEDGSDVFLSAAGGPPVAPRARTRPCRSEAGTRCAT